VRLKSGALTKQEREKLCKAAYSLVEAISDVAESFANRLGLDYMSARALHAEIVLKVMATLAETHVKAASEADRIIARRLAE